MSALRAELRRRARARVKIQVIVGVMSDRTEYSRRKAVEIADRELPPIANSQIRLALYAPGPGLKIVAETVYQNNPAGLDDIRRRLAERNRGTEPTIVVARREPLTAPPAQETTT